VIGKRGAGRNQQESVTIKEVARALDVSPSTVSRALSRPELLSEETRTRVLQAVAELGYQPNLIARGLRLKKTGLLFVIVPTLSPFFLEVFRGVERAARETGYNVLMGHTERDSARELVFLDQVSSQRADGIILVTSANQDELRARQKRIPPLVAALEKVSGIDVPSASVDHHKGAMDATNHLLALGHTRIAHIAGPDIQTIAQHRREGFREAILAADLDPDAYPIISGDYSTLLGENAMGELLTHNPPPTAVFAGNDEIAIGAIRTLKRVGLEVGRDVSVIGFDDQRIASLYEPALTTVRVPTEELGYQSALMLVKRLAGDEEIEDLVLPTTLTIRGTTGSAPQPSR
jgi:LacI family transcriptional regulator, repressor for deo operon, udp, cdd, tsx, nupC, and nupG